MKALIGCPVSDHYEPYMERWLSAVYSFGPHHEVLLADTSDDQRFFDRWVMGVQMLHLGLSGKHPTIKVSCGMEALRRRFLQGDCDYYLNLEIDVLAPQETLDEMCGLLWLGDLDVVFHDYPSRTGFGFMVGTGCTLFSKKALSSMSFLDCPEGLFPDFWFFDNVVVPQGLKTGHFHGILELEHGL
jgi:hypothetical protein